MKKAYSLLCLMLLLTLSLSAQQVALQPQKPQVKKGPKVVLKGKLIKKPWSKSTQSYCAGGSDYWVLAVGREEHVLDLSPAQIDRLKHKKGKKVKLKGHFVKKVIANPGDHMQRPSNPMGSKKDDFSCTVFKVGKGK